MSELIWKEETLLYNGKTLKKSKDDWKLFTLLFGVGRDYDFKINAWGNLGIPKEGEIVNDEGEDKKGKQLSLTIKDLEEGEYYLVKYKVEKEAFEAHGKKHDNRTVWFIEQSDEEAYHKSMDQRKQEYLKQKEGFNAVQDSKDTQSVIVSKTEEDELYTQNMLKQFMDEYKQSVEDKNMVLMAEGQPEKPMSNASAIARLYRQLHREEYNVHAEFVINYIEKSKGE